MKDQKRVAVIGASGFIGAAVADVIEAGGHAVRRLRAPRLEPMDANAAVAFIESAPEALWELRETLHDTHAVVNAAGSSDASSRDVERLTAANAALPGLIAAAAAAAGGTRFVHVSSAVVQGRRAQLDESLQYDPFSDYARSKILGEELALRFGDGQVVIFRPPSVHSIDRRVTRMTARVAASPLRSVAHPGNAPSPQALIGNVAEALAFLATCSELPPKVVAYPWEGLTTSGVMELLGGKVPHKLPRGLALGSVKTFALAGRAIPRLAADSRRVEMLWFGQRQTTSWLTEVGWSPPANKKAWQALGREIRDTADRNTPGDLPK